MSYYDPADEVENVLKDDIDYQINDILELISKCKNYAKGLTKYTKQYAPFDIVFNDKKVQDLLTTVQIDLDEYKMSVEDYFEKTSSLDDEDDNYTY